MSVAEESEYVALLDRAVSEMMAGDSTQAIELCEQAYALAPERAEVLFVFGATSFLLDDFGRAIRFMEEGHKLQPDWLEFAQALAALNARIGNLQDVSYFTKLGMMLESNPVLINYTPIEFKDWQRHFLEIRPIRYLVDGWHAYHQREYEKAADLSQRALMVDQNDADALRLLGLALIETGDFTAAVAALRRAVAAAPEIIESTLDLGDALLGMGALDEVRSVLEAAAARQPDSIEIRNRLACILPFCGDDAQSASSVFAELTELLKAQPAAAVRPSPVGYISPKDNKIRIAYLINETAISENVDFLDALLRAHDRERFQIFVYQQYTQPYVGTPRLKALTDDWRMTFDIDDITFAHIVANDRIDIIVDLCGCSPGHRQAYLASGERPLCVGWLSAPHGGAAAATDHVLSDAVTLVSEPGLAAGVSCYDLGECLVAYGSGAVQLEAEGEADVDIATVDGATFGAVLDLSRVVSSAPLWANVLKAIDGARLVLGDVDEVYDETAARIAEIFTALGVGDRVDCLTKPSTHSARAELLARADVLLDCRFVNDGGLICDALWMGVPVVSLTGRYRAGRLGTSILTAAGRPQWATEDDQEFVRIAGDLAKDRSELTSLQKNLRREIQASPLCDTDGFAKRIEAAYEQLIGRAKSDADEIVITP